jgi:uncharacterized delta-60 repeat protein
MFNRRIINSITKALVFVVGAFLIILSSNIAIAQSITDLRANDAVPGTGELADNMIYLPLVINNFYPITPEMPVLNTISNEDGDGNYTVSWSSSKGATTYTLEEDVNADFSNPTTVYSSSSISTTISGRDVGTYTYRVKASNSYAGSDWSNVESVAVTVLLPDCPQTGPWRGPTSQEDEHEIDFVVEDSPQCQIALNTLGIEFKDSCGVEKVISLNGSPLITNNHFSFNGTTTTVIGDFSSPYTASGTFSYNKEGCTASGTWTADVNLGADYTVSALAVQADGKILVGGSFNWLRGERRDRLARLNPDGTLDDTFITGANGGVTALAVQSDGKIVVGGIFTELGGETYHGIARLNSDGTLDTGFNPENYEKNTIYALVVQADGKIVVGGYFDRWDGRTRVNIARLNPDGSLDTAFITTAFDPWMGPVYTLALQNDGKILVGINGYLTLPDLKEACPIKRLNPDGSTDFTFSVGVKKSNMIGVYPSVRTLLVQPDGNILIGGHFLELEGVTRINIGRVNSDGTLDDAFNPGATPSTTGYVYTLFEQSDGKILVGGGFYTLGGETHYSIGRLNSDGSLDMDFNPEAIGYVHTLAVQADGKIVVGGNFTTLDGQTRNRIGRLNADGTLDAVFP